MNDNGLGAEERQGATSLRNPWEYHRLARRLGKQKAVMAVAHSVLVIVYHVLRDHKPYRDLGADYFDSLDKERLARQSIRRLEALGFAVTVAAQEVIA